MPDANTLELGADNDSALSLLTDTLSVGSAQAATPEQPNIVLIFLDNFGWGEPGFNGGGIVRGTETPRMDEIAAEYDGRLKVCKVDVDANPDIPPKFGIRGIPTLMLFKNGAVVGTKVGALSKSQLTAFIDSNV